MEFDAIIQAVSAVGFPIVMTVMLLVYIKDRDSKLQNSFDRMTEAFTKFETMINILAKKEDNNNE